LKWLPKTLKITPKRAVKKIVLGKKNQPVESSIHQASQNPNSHPEPNGNAGPDEVLVADQAELIEQSGRPLHEASDEAASDDFTNSEPLNKRNRVDLTVAGSGRVDVGDSKQTSQPEYAGAKLNTDSAAANGENTASPVEPEIAESQTVKRKNPKPLTVVREGHFPVQSKSGAANTPASETNVIESDAPASQPTLKDALPPKQFFASRVTADGPHSG